MALADPAAPEGVVLPLGEDGLAVDTGDGEHTGIPARRDEAEVAPLLRGGVHFGEVGGDVGVGVEAVHHAKILGQGGGQLGQVGGASAAEDEDVDLVLVVEDIRGGVHRGTRAGLDGGGITAGEDSHEIHVGVLPHGGFHAAA